MTVGEDDLLVLGDFDDAVVALVDYHNVVVGRLYCEDWGVEPVVAAAGLACDAVLPDDLALLVDDYDSVVSAGCGSRYSGGYSGSDHEGEPVGEAFGVVGSYDRVGSGVAEQAVAAAEAPDGVVGGGVDLYDAVVELVGDEYVSGTVELVRCCVLGCNGRRDYGQE